MKACGEEGVQLQAFLFSTQGSVVPMAVQPWKEPSDIHWIGVWAGLDIVEKIRMIFQYRETNPHLPVVQPYLSIMLFIR